MKTNGIKYRVTQAMMALMCLFGGAYVGWTANTDIANEPLNKGIATVSPNIMFMLDDSGSMTWEYMPDYVGAADTDGGCFDAGDSNTPNYSFFTTQDNDDTAGSITGRGDSCQAGDPPFMSPDFNKIYYNRTITYAPALNADGTSKPTQNSTNTSGWTSVSTDGIGSQNADQTMNANNVLTYNVTTTNLLTGYPDREWCQNQTDAAGAATCVVNSTYQYPDDVNKYGRNTDRSVKWRFGAPYYYAMQSAQWCNSAARTTCVSGSNIDPTLHRFQAGEFCTDSELVNCVAGSAVTAAHTFSGPRYCWNSTTSPTNTAYTPSTMTICQRKRISNYTIPKHAGTTKLVAGTVAAYQASSQLVVVQTASGQQLTGLTVNGVTIIGGAITATGSGATSRTNFATAIAASINAAVTATDYTATSSGNVVTISAAATGTAANGFPVVATTTQTGVTRANAKITVTAGSSSSQSITNIKQGATTLCSGVTAATGTDTLTKQQNVATAIAACISQNGYTATASSNIVTVLAPVSLGATVNGKALTITNGATPIPTTATTFTGGTSNAVVVTTSTLGGGATAMTGKNIRVGVGLFSRTNIVPAVNAYPRAATRIDCADTSCTYDEEMTNFANWYAYYRTRMQMAKTAAGLAFNQLDNTFRVGFITIAPQSGGTITASKYLKITAFDSTQRTAWYSKLYGTVRQTSGTPLREALSRVGQIYAGPGSGGYANLAAGIPTADDPIQYSCQPNFTILSTDGYWNGNGGQTMAGGTLGQQDTTNAGYSLQSDGAYDAIGGTVGLADVALYYYQTDLRPTMTDNVRAVGRDTAPHQHMTTYTIGLGLDGALTYRPDYLTASTGDFVSVKQGSLNWPQPAADSPSALDDLWHAAVNGRGIFYSAGNASDLANSLSDALNNLKQGTGAGAAAATSNLQPVAGDNFAFTAEFTSVEWTGDVKARTIDLGSGIVSNRQLWSARTWLDANPHTARTIFTFDPTDSGSTGNMLKHFCWPQASVSWCSDGTGLNATEQNYFLTSQLAQVSTWSANQVTNATSENLVNFIRGDNTYEISGAVGDTDIFRSRNSKLGDVVNAQPVYVKNSRFSYADTGYTAFQACTKGVGSGCPTTQFPTPANPRRPTVYVAANDGILHAFETDVNNNPYYQTAGVTTLSTSDDTFTGNNTGNGVERWAYIPGFIMPNLYRLANDPYTHKYTVDGAPTVADICISNPCAGLNDWRTILVAGVNAGGRGLYALDVSNPLAPIGLWEFTVRKPSVASCAATVAAAVGATDDCDLGYTFGNPIVTKFNGQWVVIVSSGHNNSGAEPGTTTRQGDGQGYLFILNAVTGAIIKKIPTGVGSGGTLGANYADADPSGLGRLNAWLAGPDNNTAQAIYGGDLKGNLWRFDLDSASATYLTAVKVAALTTSGGVPQPITSKPELTAIGINRVVFVGTGQLLGITDLGTTNQQTIYAIRDDLSGNVTVTNRSGLRQQTLTEDVTAHTRTITNNAVDWTNASVRGWYVDLPTSGERVNVDPVLQLGTLAIGTNIPAAGTSCGEGTAWVMTFDAKTGSYVPGSTSIGTFIASSVVVGVNVIQLPTGTVKAIVTTADNSQLTRDIPVVATGYGSQRVTWRELDTAQ